MQIHQYIKNKLEGFVSDSDEWHYHNHQPIKPDQYKDFVSEWINKGACSRWWLL